MNRALSLLAPLVLCLGAGPVLAQHALDRARIEWVSGYIDQGSLADASFVLDVSAFQGPIIARSNGTLDVDPSPWYGLRGTYRLNERLSLGATWMHSRGRYRVQFPALATIDGNFDLEGLILAGEDFQAQGEPGVRATSAMSDALTDLYLASVSYEVPVLRGWAFPYLTVGAGVFTQKSDGDVIRLEYDSALPTRVEGVENIGLSPAGEAGLSVFQIDSSDWALSVGGGMRVALSDRWGVSVGLEDVVRLNADLTHLDATSTPPPNQLTGSVYSTTFTGKEGVIHNFALRLAVNYAVWPFGAPR
ncbi:MAG: hypothetical protein ACT4PE_07730 [Candidatus Eiseniibacteriota bacterium]